MTRPFAFPAILLAALLALAAAGCARAEPLVRMDVLDLDRGELLPQYPHRGRGYVEGRPGHRYAVVLQNLTGGRVLAVVSVDGVNAITGETAGASQGGYVLGPWQRLEVRGWRKNLSEIAEFHFTSLGDSYAARTGRPGNVGVIGVAAFRERVPPPVYYAPPPPYSGGPYPGDGYRGAAEAQAEAGRAASAPAAADAAAPTAQAESSLHRDDGLASRQRLGTGHGERRWDAASVTTFERASTRPAQVATLWYDAAEALAARGILPRWHPYGRDGTPEPFPVGFAPDPY
jgi:hypothetical protein